jgi:hypothetical protein
MPTIASSNVPLPNRVTNSRTSRLQPQSFVGIHPTSTGMGDRARNRMALIFGATTMTTVTSASSARTQSTAFCSRQLKTRLPMLKPSSQRPSLHRIHGKQECGPAEGCPRDFQSTGQNRSVQGRCVILGRHLPGFGEGRQDFFRHYPQFRQSTDAVTEHDRTLFDELTALLSSDGAIGFIDRHNMAGWLFRDAELEPLRGRFEIRCQACC